MIRRFQGLVIWSKSIGKGARPFITGSCYGHCNKSGCVLVSFRLRNQTLAFVQIKILKISNLLVKPKYFIVTPFVS